MSTSRRHHYVSRGYLNGFADGRRLRLLDHRRKLSVDLVGTADVFVERDFYTITDHDGKKVFELEEEWSKQEATVLPLARLVADQGALDDNARRILVNLAALMFCRGMAFKVVHERIEAQHLANLRQRITIEPQFREAWISDHGSEPTDDELRRVVDQSEDDMFGGNRLLADTMADMYNRFGTELGDKWQIQLLRPRSNSGFSTSDNPLVLATDRRSDGLLRFDRIGVQNGLAIGDSSFVFLPLRRDTAVVFTTEDPLTAHVDNKIVEALNRLTWENSLHQVACHPDEHISVVAHHVTPLDGWTLKKGKPRQR